MEPKIDIAPNPQITVATKTATKETDTPTTLKEKILSQAPIIIQLADNFASLKETLISKTAEASAALVQSEPVANLLDQAINFVSDQVTEYNSTTEAEATVVEEPATTVAEKQTEPTIEKPGLLTRCLNWCKSLVQPTTTTAQEEATPSLWDRFVSGAQAVANFISSPIDSVSSFVSNFYTGSDSTTTNNSFSSWISSIAQPVTDWVSSIWNNQGSSNLETASTSSYHSSSPELTAPLAQSNIHDTALIINDLPAEKREIANCKSESLPTELINLAKEFGIPVSSSTQAIEIYSKLPAAQLQSFLRTRGIDISGVLSELSNNGLGHLQVSVLTKALQDRTPYAAREIAKVALAQDFKAKHIADANVSLETIQTFKRNYMI